jgi:hypothetical protein
MERPYQEPAWNLSRRIPEEQGWREGPHVDVQPPQPQSDVDDRLEVVSTT